MNNLPLSGEGGTRGLATRAGGMLLLCGAGLIVVMVALPPPAQRSDWVILALGGAAAGAAALLLRTRVAPEWMLAGAALLGTAVITGATYEAGGTGAGAEDNEILYLWIALYCFYFFTLRHALAQLAVVGVAYGTLLIAQGPADTILTRWLTTMVTLLIAGLLVARLRDQVGGMVNELGRRARLDSLTTALNRRGLLEEAGVELARAGRDRSPISMIELDVDGFKALNDSLGHPAGDAVLKEVVRIVTEHTRPTDAVGRVGGDEFAVLLPGASSADAGAVAARLRDRVRTICSQRAKVTVSLGVVTAEGPPQVGFDQLWAKADAAMYAAKRAGGDRVAIAAPIQSLDDGSESRTASG